MVWPLCGFAWLGNQGHELAMDAAVVALLVAESGHGTGAVVCFEFFRTVYKHFGLANVAVKFFGKGFDFGNVVIGTLLVFFVFVSVIPGWLGEVWQGAEVINARVRYI